MFSKLNIKNTNHSYPDLQPLPRHNSSSANVNKLSKILLCHLFWIQNRADRSSIHLPLKVQCDLLASKSETKFSLQCLPIFSYSVHTLEKTKKSLPTPTLSADKSAARADSFSKCCRIIWNYLNVLSRAQLANLECQCVLKTVYSD